MRLTRFQTLLDARGPHIDHWPEADRAAARTLLAGSDDACTALAEAQALDRALRALPAEGASPLLRSAILDISELHDRAAGDARGGWISGRRGFAVGWAAIAASAAIGFAIGAWGPAEPPAWQSEDLAALVYGVPDFDPEFEKVLR